MKRAAVVIGIDSTGELPVLRAAASGARSFGAWLAGEGFEVSFFVDDQVQEVTASAIEQHITRLIDQGSPEQLVIYFAGHGFLKGYSEFWMLPKAPRSANEAINVAETIELARASGIKNVVVISDACRSIPQSLQAERVQGSLIFPNELAPREVSPEIDRFFAARAGEPAAEMVVDKSVQQYEGIFTHCFLDAFREPDAAMVRQVTIDGSAYEVVPNRKLKEYLHLRVPALMQSKGYIVPQKPDAILESGEDVYLGRVRHYGHAGVLVEDFGIPKDRVVLPPPREILDVRDVARVALADAMGLRAAIPAVNPNEIAAVARETGFDASVNLVETAQTQAPGHFETKCGLSVTGARISEVVGLHMRAELLNEMGTDKVRLFPGQAGVFGQNGHVSSVVLRFVDGSGTVLVGLSEFIGTVAVEQGRVMNVSYAPSENTWRWQDYKTEQPQLDKNRALVAAAARYGVFRVNKENAESLAGMIRVLKGIDPTLGLYAAYAYAEVGMTDRVKSVMSYMRDDPGVRLFDVAMLANDLADGRPHPEVVPFCPMLSQGWNLRRVKRAAIPPALEGIADHLLPALWTTFDSAGMDIIFRAIDRREIC